MNGFMVAAVTKSVFCVVNGAVVILVGVCISCTTLPVVESTIRGWPVVYLTSAG